MDFYYRNNTFYNCYNKKFWDYLSLKMPDLIKQIVGGIFSAIVIVVLLYAFFSVTKELKENSPSPEATKIIEDTEKNVESAIKGYHVVGGITFIIGIIALVLFILDRFDVLKIFQSRGSL